jgi:hypothetical protein
MSNNTRNIIYNAVKDNGVHNFPNVQNSKNLKRVKERRNIEGATKDGAYRVKLVQSRSPGTRAHWINPPTVTFQTKQAPQSQTSRKKEKQGFSVRLKSRATAVLLRSFLS